MNEKKKQLKPSRALVNLLKDYAISPLHGNPEKFIEQYSEITYKEDLIQAFKTIDNLEQEYQQIKKNKEESSMTTEQSLKIRFEELRRDNPGLDKAKLGDLVQSGHIDSNDKQSVDIDHIDETQIINEDQLELMTAAMYGNSLDFKEQSEVDTEISEEEGIIINEYLEEEKDYQKAKDFKKIYTASLLDEKVKGNEELQDYSPTEIAILADGAATFAQLSYAVGKGKIELNSMFEELVDRTAASLIVIVKSTVPSLAGKLGETIGASIGRVFGPKGSKIIGELGRQLCYAAGEKAAEFVSQGIKKFSAYVKDTYKEIVKDLTKTLKNWIFG